RWCDALRSFAFHQLLERLDNLCKAQERCTRTQRLTMGTGRVTRPRLPARDVPEPARFPRAPRAIANGVVSGHANLPREDDAIAQARRAGDADLRHDQTESSDAHVMGDLHEVVELRSGTDHGGVEAAPIAPRG